MAQASDASQPPAALPELAEADAPQEIQAIYREISGLSGIPLPALIWRHLATHDGVLDEAWTAVRPLYASGIIQEAAWQVAARALQGETSVVSRAKLREVRLAPEVEAAYERVLHSYNRSNPINAIAIRLLLAGMAPGAPQHGVPVATSLWTPPSPIEGLPPMAPVAEIRVVERQQINRLAAEPSIDRSRVVPSLYRHLVEWPALIRLIHNDLEPRIRSGELPALLARVTAALDAEIARLEPHIPALPRLAAMPGLGAVMAQFSGGLIPEMIVIGHLLRNGLDRTV